MSDCGTTDFERACLTKEQEARLVQFCDEYRKARGKGALKKAAVSCMIVDLGLHAGLSPTEMLDVRLEDLHRAHGRSGYGYRLEVRGTRNGKKRQIPVDSRFHSRWTALVWQKPGWRRPRRPRSRLLVNQRGTAFTLSGVQRNFKALARRAGLPESVGVRHLRGTYIVNLLKAGLSPRTVQRRAGYATLRSVRPYEELLKVPQLHESQ
jgi:site-specific recombinase XerD